ncbi:MAG TPA: hypothetical protein VM223_26265 [Planctomycetota bacterium]|nr:hypothetical protein [Planctomycetota bacterium]
MNSQLRAQRRFPVPGGCVVEIGEIGDTVAVGVALAGRDDLAGQGTLDPVFFEAALKAAIIVAVDVEIHGHDDDGVAIAGDGSGIKHEATAGLHIGDQRNID